MRHPRIAVDAVIINKKGEILLIKRKNEPYKGYWALPGGFVEYGEKVEEALKREIKEETGLKAKKIELVGVYSDPKRDPRGHVISIAYLVEETEGKPKPATDAQDLNFFSKLPEKIAFDHRKILKDTIRKI